MRAANMAIAITSLLVAFVADISFGSTTISGLASDPTGLVSHSDLFENATILSNSPVLNDGHGTSDPRNMFGGTYGNVVNYEENNTLFADGNPPGTVSQVTFQPLNGPVTIEGYDLYLNADDFGNGSRDAARFRLLTGSGTVLDDVQILPDASSQYSSTYGSPYIRIHGVFDAPVTASTFQAEFTQSFITTASYGGVRVQELDAISTPEPASLGLMAFFGFGMLMRRRGRQ